MLMRYGRKLAGVAAASLLGMIGLTGCDSMDSEADGRVQVYLTDAPQAALKTSGLSASSAPTGEFAAVDSALLVIDRVELVGDTSEAAGLLLTDDAVTLNLLEFESGVDTLLANELVPAGDYQQLRFYVNQATIYVGGDTEGQSLNVPSGFVRINLPEFEIDEADDIVVIKIDLSVERSLVARGNGQYNLKPVIHPVEFAINGEDVPPPPPPAETDTSGEGQ